MSSGICFNLDRSKILLSGDGLYRPCFFLHVCNVSLLKTLLEKEKLLFTISPTHLENFLPFLSNMKLSSENTFSLEEARVCPLRKG